jgi:hypothetical protein
LLNINYLSRSNYQLLVCSHDYFYHNYGLSTFKTTTYLNISQNQIESNQWHFETLTPDSEFVSKLSSRSLFLYVELYISKDNDIFKLELHIRNADPQVGEKDRRRVGDLSSHRSSSFRIVERRIPVRLSSCSTFGTLPGFRPEFEGQNGGNSFQVKIVKEV